MKAIIFGANGQDGFYLAELLRREKIKTVKISRSGNNSIGDVADWKFVEDVIRLHKPEYIFHLAANSTTRHEAVFDNHQAISTGAINILEALYRHGKNSKIFFPGSAMQFANDGMPIDEKTSFAPLSPYAVSRIQTVYAARYYRTLGLKIYIGYFFNHDSPLRSKQHVNQKIALAAKRSEHIEIGDISVEKEFNFAGDIIEAVWRLVNQDEIYEVVIGSGKAHRIEEWLELCFAAVEKDWRDYVNISEDFIPEYKILVSKPDLIKSLGWRAKIDIDGLAKMMMER